MIRAAGVIPDRLRAPQAEKCAAGLGKFFDEGWLGKRDTQMFGRNAIRETNRGFERRRNEYGACGSQRLPGRICFWQFLKLPVDLRCNIPRQSCGRCNQQRDSVWIMLSLRQQIRGDKIWLSSRREN